MIASPVTRSRFYIKKSRRGYFIALCLFMSLSGLFTGLTIRQIAHEMVAGPTIISGQPVAMQTTVAVGKGTGQSQTSQKSAPTFAPQAFYVNFTLSTYSAAPGSVLTVTGTAQTQSGASPTENLRAVLTIGSQQTIVKAVPSFFNAQGQAVWKILIPQNTAPGDYMITMQAFWGQYSAVWEEYITIISAQ